MIDQAWNVLTDREADILRLREQRVPINKIAEKYGISYDRVRQITAVAKRKLHDAQRQILAYGANQMLVPTQFSRSDLMLIKKALGALQEQRFHTVTFALCNLADITDNDPLYSGAENLIKQIEELLNSTEDEVRSFVEEGMRQSQE